MICQYKTEKKEKAATVGRPYESLRKTSKIPPLPFGGED